MLLESGFDVNSQNKKGETPLMRALNNFCKFEVIQLLIKYEANVNMLSNDGCNIFQFASPTFLTNLPLVKLILISGFNLKLLTKS